jgi:NitT/TauT family transport system substrate-binding protein
MDLTAPHTRRTFVASAAALGASSVLLGCGADEEKASGSGSGTKKVTVLNILPPIMGYAGEYIAELDGHFEREGLKVETQTARGSAPAIQSLIGGQGLLSRVGMIETVAHVSNKGAPLIGVAQTTRVSPLMFVSSKEHPLRTPADFKGKAIGIPSEGGTSENTLDVLLAAGGVPIDSVKRQVVGFSPGTFEVVKKGRLAAFIASASAEVQFRKEVPDAELLPSAKFVTDGECYLVTKKGLESGRETVVKYLRAVRAATLQIIDDKGFTKTIETLRASRYRDVDGLDDDEVAAATLQWLVDAWTKDGRDKVLKVDPAMWQKVYDDLLKIKAAKPGLDPKRWVDTSLA